ncbi:MAG: type VII toxin-antitoxin system HepT family RNase toxin [Eubacteriales bacterium]
MTLSVDLNKIRQKAADLRDALSNLTPYAGGTVEKFLNDKKGNAAAKYYLIVATEAAIDICNHLAARVASRAPGSYAECFEILKENCIISEALAGSLIPMARFRNLLIHRYADVDNRLVYKVICCNLQDLESYLSELAVFLKEKI